MGQSAFLTSVGLPSSDGATPNALTQTAWFIDPINGADTNNGATSTTALKTFAELNRRWGVGNTLRPTTGAAGGGTVTVNILNSLPINNTDPISFNVNMADGATLLFQGGAPVQTPLTVTAVRTKNRATNTPWALTLSGTTPASLIETRIRDLTNSGIMWGVKDEGSSVLRVSEPFAHFNPGAFLTNALRVTPLNTDTFVAETLITVQPGVMQFNGGRTILQTAGSTLNRSVVLFFDLNFDGGDFAPELGPNTSMGFDQCHYGRNAYIMNCIANTIANSCTHTAGSFIVESASVSFKGGAVMPVAGSGGFQTNNSIIQFDFDIVCQGCSIAAQCGTFISVGTAAFFDSVVTSGSNTHSTEKNLDGSGLYQSGNGNVSIIKNADTTSAFWGSGNASAGLNVITGTALYDNVANLTCTGTGGDFKLGNQATLAYSFNAGTVAYNPAVSCSWANLAVADGYPSGLFYPQKQAGITKAT